MTSLLRCSLVACLAVVASACGAGQFNRTAGAGRYPALPAQTEVLLIAQASELPPPTEELGSLTSTSLHGESDRPAVESEFKSLARRVGCDVVAEVALRDEQHASMQIVRKPGKDGRVEQVPENVVTHTWRWSARCVRTAKVGFKGRTEATENETAAGSRSAATTTTTKSAAVEKEPCSGVPGVQRDLCQRLDGYTGAYLLGWKSKLHVAKPDPVDLLQSFAELIAQVTGPGGFWRKTVPQQWYGCAADASTAPCQRIAAATSDFKKYDQLAELLVGVPPGQASAWLQRHNRQLLDYLDAYVPEAANLTGAQGTAFYKSRLQ